MVRRVRGRVIGKRGRALDLPRVVRKRLRLDGLRSRLQRGVGLARRQCRVNGLHLKGENALNVF